MNHLPLDRNPPDGSPVSRLAKDILSHPVCPEGGEIPHETFEEELGQHTSKPDSAKYADLLATLKYIAKKTASAPCRAGTTEILSRAPAMIEQIKRNYQDFIEHDRATLGQPPSEEDREEAMQDIPRNEAALENLDSINGMIGRLAAIVAATPPRARRSR